VLVIRVVTSAGVGRTGVFIVIDSMLERIKHVDTVDIYGHVTCVRAQRNYMVQTEDQYVFIHDALLEAITSGNTEILARNLRCHVTQLLQPISNQQQQSTTTGLQLEFDVRSYTDTPLSPPSPAGTQFSDFTGMEGWVDLDLPGVPKNGLPGLF